MQASVPRIGLSDVAIEDLQKSGLEPRDVAARAIGMPELASCSTTLTTAPNGYVLPYFDVDGQLVQHYRLKLINKPDSSLPKYLQPKGSRNHIYFPLGFKKLLESESDTSYIIITEGEKKAACAVKMGFPCIALSGINSWTTRSILIPEDTELVKLGNMIQAKVSGEDGFEIHNSGTLANGLADLIDLMVHKRYQAIIIFDSDYKEGGVKMEVQRAAAQLGHELRFRGMPISHIRQAVLPIQRDIPKMGLDDFLLLRKAAGLGALIRGVKARRNAFPQHPNLKSHIGKMLSAARMSRKQCQEAALSILMDLEARGRRIYTPKTKYMHYFDEHTHTLMQVTLNNPKVPLHETPFGAFLYKEYNLGAADQRIVAWLATQYSGEAGMESATTHKVLAFPEGPG